MKCTWQPLEAADFNKADYGDWQADGEMLSTVAGELAEVLGIDYTLVLDGVGSEELTFLEHKTTGDIIAVFWGDEISYWQRVCSSTAADKAGFPWQGLVGAGVGATGGYLVGSTRAMGRNGTFGALLGALLGGGAGILLRKKTRSVGRIPFRLRNRGPMGRIPPGVQMRPRGAVGAAPERVQYKPRGPIGVGYVPPSVQYGPRGPVGYGSGLNCASC